VSDALLRGLNHALSNRVASLSAIATVITLDERSDPDITRALAAEVAQLEGVLRLLRLLPGGRGAPSEPVLLSDALADAVALHAHHAGLAATPCTVVGDASSLLPVVAPLPALVHGLALLLGALALHARGADDALDGASERRGVLRVSGDERAVRLTGAAPPGEGEPGLAPDAVAAALQELLDDAGATVTVEKSAAGGVRYEVVLPTLVVVRERRG
jgi:hypothetical protein